MDDITKKKSEEYRNYLENLEIKKYGRLTFAYARIQVLEEYMEIIKQNKDQFKLKINKKAVEIGNHPAYQLFEYIILEISNFYTLCYHYSNKEGVDFPEFPPYWETLKNFRNLVPGHLDKEGNLDTIKKWLEQYDLLLKIELDNIIKDFYSYYNICCEMFEKEI